jgi:hypothetical protein
LFLEEFCCLLPNHHIVLAYGESGDKTPRVFQQSVYGVGGLHDSATSRWNIGPGTYSIELLGFLISVGRFW